MTDATPHDFTAGVIVAESRPRERFDVEYGQRWTTYRVRRITSAEYDQFHRDRVIGSHNLGARWLLESRATKTTQTAEGETLTREDSAWLLWQLEQTPDAAIYDMLGDSEFLEAVSLHLAHAELVQHVRAVRAASDRQHAAEKKTAALAERIEDLRREGNRAYSDALRKAGDDQKKIDRAGARLRAKFQPQIDAARAELLTAQAEHATASAAVTDLAGKRPRVLDCLPSVLESAA